MSWVWRDKNNLNTEEKPANSGFLIRNHGSHIASLVVQWLRLHVTIAEGMGSTPGQGARILCCMIRPNKTKTRKQENKKGYNLGEKKKRKEETIEARGKWYNSFKCWKKRPTRNPGLPWWLGGKESTCPHRSHRLHPDPGRPHMLWGNQSPCATTTEPVLQSGKLLSPCATTTEARMPERPRSATERSHHNEKPVHPNYRVVPISAKREKPMQQRRPGTAKNKYIKILKTTTHSPIPKENILQEWRAKSSHPQMKKN